MSELNEKVEEPQEQAPDRAPMPDEELQKILEAHRMWVESEGKEGEIARLYEANLQKAFLRGANLQGADLRWANLSRARMIQANLRGADLRNAINLTAPQVKPAENWELALYSGDFLKILGLKPDHNETVEKRLAEFEKEKKATDAQ